MPRQCSVCGKQAVVAAKVNDGHETVNAFLCDQCLRAACKFAEIRVVASAVPAYQAGQILGSLPVSKEPEADPLDDYEFDKPPESQTHDENHPEPINENTDEEKDVPKWKSILILTIKTVCVCVLTFLVFYVLDIVINFVTGSNNKTKDTLPTTEYSSISTPTSSYSVSQSNTPYIPETISDSLMSKMWDAAKEEVKKNLKSPSTAKFEKYYSNNVQFIKAKAEDVETGGFNVSILAYVDSQNGFGAEIRTTFVVFFMVDRSGSFKIVDSLY